MTKQDFIDWKQHPVTNSFMKAIIDKRAGLIEGLAYSAGIDPSEDSCKRGAILTCTDILNTEYSELGDVE